MNSKNSIEYQSTKPIATPVSYNLQKKLYDTNMFQLANVVDIIIDESHPFFKKNSTSVSPITRYLNPTQISPHNYKQEPVSSSDINYTYIGRIKFRLLDEHKQVPIDKLSWAIPLDNTITQYPLINELVLILQIGNSFYYTKPFNKYNFLGSNPDFYIELSNSSNGSKLIPDGASELKQSYLKHPLYSSNSDIGYLGKNFVLNPNIRHVKISEGDTVIESRFGQSIRFSAYDSQLTSNVNKGSAYTVPKNKLRFSKDGSYGNPKIVIRNRQRDLKQDFQIQLHPKLPILEKIKLNDSEKNYGGYIEENINYDGSTIEIISGELISAWKTTVYKSIFSVKSDNETNIISGEEQSNFCPAGSTSFKFPTLLNGDQVIINSDRLILSSRFSETFHFSKKRYSIVTDSEYTVDAHDQIILTTNTLTCLNSPQIFLGQYGETNEPALLGQTTVDWLYDLCDWLLNHVHWYDHVHPHPHTHVDAGEVLVTDQQGIYDYSGLNTQNSNPNKTQLPVQQEQLKRLRENLHSLMSRRVFLTGGGYAPGSNGIKPKNSNSECKDPVNINPFTGEGVIGSFKGSNRREGKYKIEFVPSET